MRVFSAVDIENEEILEELERIQEKIDLGFNLVPRDKMHITLQFFEEVDQGQLEEIEEGLKSISMDPFAAEIKGLGAFPSHDYIRVVWAGAGPEKLHDLYEQVSAHDIPESSDHEFNPHITLARVRDISPGKKRKLQKSLREFADHEFGMAKVDSVKIFESHLTGKGSSYRLLKEKEL